MLRYLIHKAIVKEIYNMFTRNFTKYQLKRGFNEEIPLLIDLKCKCYIRYIDIDKVYNEVIDKLKTYIGE